MATLSVEEIQKFLDEEDQDGQVSPKKRKKLQTLDEISSFLDEQDGPEADYLDAKSYVPGAHSKKVADALEANNRRAEQERKYDARNITDKVSGQRPDLPVEPASLTTEVIKQLPRFVKEVATDAISETAAAGAFMGAGAVKGATAGYIDPTKALEKTHLADENISKNIATGTGQLLGLVAPITAISKGVGYAGRLTNLARLARPAIERLALGGATGAIFGATRKPEEGETRGENALKDSALFMAFVGAEQSVARLFSKKIVIPDTKKEEVAIKAAQRGSDAYLKGASKAQARRIAIQTLEEEAAVARQQIKAGSQEAKALQPEGYTEAATEVQIPTKFSRYIDEIMERVRKPSVSRETKPISTVEGKPAQEAINPKAEQYLAKNYPKLQETVKASGKAGTEVANDVLLKAVAAGEKIKLQGGTVAEAQAAAMETFGKELEAKLSVELPKPQNVPAIGAEKSLPVKEQIKVVKAQAEVDLPKPSNVGEIPIEKITKRPDVYQFRDSDVNEWKVQNMVENFDPYQLTPIVVRKSDSGKFEILSGHHRLEMAKRRGMESLPAIVYDVDVPTAREIAKKSNSMAEGYSPLEEAKIFDQEIKAGKSFTQIGKEYGGKPPKYVERMTYLNNLSGEMKGFLRDNALDLKTAMVLGQKTQELKLTPEIQSEIYHKFITVSNVTPAVLDKTLSLFGSEMVKQIEMFGDLEGTSTKRGFVSMLNEVLEQIKGQEKEAGLFRQTKKLIESYRKQGKELPKSLLVAEKDIARLEEERIKSIASLKKSIGQEKLPSLAKEAAKAKAYKRIEQMEDKGEAVLTVPKQILPERLPENTAVFGKPSGTVVYSDDFVSPETVELNDLNQQKLFDEEPDYMPKRKFKTAVRFDEKEIVVNDRGETHAQLMDRFPADWEERKMELGYMDEQDNFLTSEQAYSLMFPNDPPMKASDLNADYKIDVTKTAAFKEWFGDSKVVDADGKPLVVYHGSGTKISEFKFQFTNQGNDQFGSGFYFTTDKVEAEFYTQKRKYFDTPKLGGEDFPNVVEVYLSIKNPMPEGKIQSLTKKQVRMFIERSPVKMESLYNFADIEREGYEKAMKEAIFPYSQEDSETPLFQRLFSLANDFYPESEHVEVFNKAIKDILGYDGFVSTEIEGKRHYVAFFPSQIKSATENRGTFDPSDPNIAHDLNVQYFPTAPVFYSQLQKTITELMPETAPLKQVRDIIKNAKQEEVAWSGIETFLEGRESVSKKDLIEFLKNNEIKIETKSLGKDVGRTAQEYMEDASSMQEIALRWQKKGDEVKAKKYFDMAEKANQKAAKAASFDVEQIGLPKFETYTIPGGTNYKELLLTLPSTKPVPKIIETERGFIIVDSNGSPIGPFRDGEPIAYHFRGLAEQALADSGKGERVFFSGHFPVKNIVAHIRTVDRMSVNKESILHLEEVQSDWHQEGRRVGYRRNQYDIKITQTGKEAPNGEKYYRVEVDGKYFGNSLAESEAQVSENVLQQLNINPEGVPDSPFKKTWHELAMKRALRYAVETNRDVLAWTTGEQQAERYDLSKQVKSVFAEKIISGPKTGKYKISADDDSGKVVFDDVVEENRLSEFVGKDLAQKITSESSQYLDGKKYSGLDLKVGGEGMKTFYDKILPSFMNKYVKRWGGVVEKVEFKSGGKTVEAHAVKITPKMREDIETRGQALFEKQLGLFGGYEPETGPSLTAKNDQRQLEIFSKLARPQFELPMSAYAKHPEGKGFRPRQEDFHQRNENMADQPEALMESSIVKDVRDVGLIDVAKRTISGPDDVAALVYHLKNTNMEKLYAVGTDEKGNILGVQVVSIGTLNSTLFHPREAFQALKLLGAKNAYFVHNHPSGNPSPTSDDITVTQQAVRAGNVLGIKVRGHAVIDDDKYTWINEKAETELKDIVIPSERPEQISVFEPMQERQKKERALTSPDRAVAEVSQFVYSRKNSYTVTLLDSRKQVNGVWQIPLSENVDEIVKMIAPLVLRNNAAGVILATGDKISNFAMHKQVNEKLMESIGVPLFDSIKMEDDGSFKSAREIGVFDAENPYRTGQAPKDTALEKFLNKRRGKIMKMRGEIGISEEEFTKIKINVTGKSHLEEMGNVEIEKMIKRLNIIKRTGQSTMSLGKDPEFVRQQLKIPTDVYKEIRKQEAGLGEGEVRQLTEAEKEKIITRMTSYPIDIRGNAIVHDIARGPAGIKIDKKFAEDVSGYYDLNGYEMRFLDIRRALMVADPSGHLKRISMDLIENAYNTVLEMQDKIRREIDAVSGGIRPKSKESERMMRFGEGRYGEWYLTKIDKTIADLSRDADAEDGSARGNNLRYFIKKYSKERKKAEQFKPELITEKEIKTLEFIRAKYNEFIDMANKVRDLHGKDPIPYRQDYFTHMWQMNALEKLFGGTQRQRTAALAISDYTHPNAPFNPYALVRKGATGYEDDAIGVFDAYMGIILKETFYRTPIKQIRAMQNNMPGNLGRMIGRWADEMAGKTSAMDKMGTIPEEILGFLQSMTNAATSNALIGNLNFILTNATNPVITFGEIGPWVLHGQLYFFTPGGYKFAWENSKLLKSRTNIFELDYSRMSAIKSFLAGNFIEYNNVATAFLGGYLKAKHEGKSLEQAIEIGDDLAAKTQADYRKFATSSYLRSKLGRTFGRLQTYPFNLMHHIVYDKLGTRVALPDFTGQWEGHARSVKKDFFKKLGKMMLLVAGAYSVNHLMMRLIGRSPYEARAFFPQVPFIPQFKGSVRPPIGFQFLETAFASADYLGARAAQDEQIQKKKWEIAKKKWIDSYFLYAFPFPGINTGGGQQVKRLLEGNILPKGQVKAREKYLKERDLKNFNRTKPATRAFTQTKAAERVYSTKESK